MTVVPFRCGHPFWGRVVVFIRAPSVCRNFLWLVAALFPGLSLLFASGLSSPGLICCYAMSLRYVTLLSSGCAPTVCLATGFVAFFPVLSLLLALVVQVPVGSLLPYGSQLSRWGHPCGVEAGLLLDRNEGLVCFSFPFGLFLRVATVLRDVVTIWVKCVGRFPLVRDLRLSLVDSCYVLHPLYF